MTRSAKFKTALGAALVLLAMAFGAGAASAAVPTGFKDEAVFSGLNQPTIVKFAPDGRVFVAEKGGKILVFENLEDETPEVFADLSKPVYDYEDHGLLGLTIDPLFDLGRPYVYAIYTFNHELADKGVQTPQVTDPKSVTPRWASKNVNFEEDKCPNGEKAKEEHIKEDPGCEVSGLVVRLEQESGTDHAAPSAAAPDEKVLLEGWCQQSTTHSIGNLGFGPEGNLFVTGGEGAMFSEPDYGQFGNPCEDPPETGPAEPVRLTAEGGSLRSQSVLRDHTAPDSPTLLSGSVLRVDPDTGEGVPGNPYAASSEANARRIIAFGFRQPWRFAFNPRTSHLFVDNVGNGHYEEMDRLPLNGAASYANAGIPFAEGGNAYNSGWPCYEGGPTGPARNNEYAGEYPPGTPEPSIQVCINQYRAEDEGKPQTSAPFFAYAHNGPIAPGDPCDTGGPTDIGGISFYEGTNYPKSYADSLFFSDPIRGCIYVMKAGADGEPIPSTVTTFASGKSPFSFPAIDIEQGPEGDIFYTEFGHGTTGGTLQRISYSKAAKEAEEREEREAAERPAREAAEREAREQAEREARERASKPVTPITPPPPTYDPPKLYGKPEKSTAKTTAKFTFGAASGLRFRCKIDGKAFGGCKSPRTYKNLKVGKHSFRVYAIDSSGARAAANTQFNWKVVAGK